MSANNAVLVGWSDKPETLLLNRANRHGLVAGATGTGKTVTLQILAQGFSDAGVPVFAADVKGDLSGICMPGDRLERFAERAKEMGLDLEACGSAGDLLGPVRRARPSRPRHGFGDGTAAAGAHAD